MDREKLSRQLDDLWERVDQNRSAPDAKDLPGLTRDLAAIEKELADEQVRLLRETLAQKRERWGRYQEEREREIGQFRQRLRMTEARLEQRAQEIQGPGDDAALPFPPPAFPGPSLSGAPGDPLGIESFVRLLSSVRQQAIGQRLVWKRSLADARHASPGRLAETLHVFRGALPALRQAAEDLLGVPCPPSVEKNLQDLIADSGQLLDAVDSMRDKVSGLGPVPEEEQVRAVRAWSQAIDGAWEKWWTTVDRVETDVVTLAAGFGRAGARGGDLSALLEQRDHELAEARRKLAAWEERERTVLRSTEELKREFQRLEAQQLKYVREADPLYREWQEEKGRLVQQVEEARRALQGAQEECRGHAAALQQNAALERRHREAAAEAAELRRAEADGRLRFEQELAAERQRGLDSAEEFRRRLQASETRHRIELQSLQAQWLSESERLQAEIRALRQANDAAVMDRLRRDGELAAAESQRRAAQAALDELSAARGAERGPRPGASDDLRRELDAALKRLAALETGQKDLQAEVKADDEELRRLWQASPEREAVATRDAIDSLKREMAGHQKAWQAAQEDWRSERERLQERLASEDARRSAEWQKMEGAWKAREAAWQSERATLWSEIKRAQEEFFAAVARQADARQREEPAPRPAAAPASAPAAESRDAVIQQWESKAESLMSRVKDLEQRLLNYQEQVSSLQAGVKEGQERERQLQALLDQAAGATAAPPDLARGAAPDAVPPEPLPEAGRKRASGGERLLDESVPRERSSAAGRLLLLAALFVGVFALPWGVDRVWVLARERLEAQRKARAETYFKKGFEAMSAGEVGAAADEFSRALSEDPEHAQAKKLLVLSLWDLADQHIENKDWRAARQTLDALATHLPGNPEVAERKKFVREASAVAPS